eukprot:COSAG04_NODE_1095_length_8308_cov_5.921793_9_plen_91_part_00
MSVAGQSSCVIITNERRVAGLEIDGPRLVEVYSWHEPALHLQVAEADWHWTWVRAEQTKPLMCHEIVKFSPRTRSTGGSECGESTFSSAV